jgi:hypothetical protein
MNPITTLVEIQRHGVEKLLRAAAIVEAQAEVEYEEYEEEAPDEESDGEIGGDE